MHDTVTRVAHHVKVLTMHIFVFPIQQVCCPSCFSVPQTWLQNCHNNESSSLTAAFKWEPGHWDNNQPPVCLTAKSAARLLPAVEHFIGLQGVHKNRHSIHWSNNWANRVNVLEPEGCEITSRLILHTLQFIHMVVVIGAQEDPGDSIQSLETSTTSSKCL
jgi:hypothetical protein